MSGTRASRRHFIGATGLALSAPLAGLGVATGEAIPASPSPDDLSAIRDLMHAEAFRLAVKQDALDWTEQIIVAADGRSATATLPCTIEVFTPIKPDDHPLIEMARQQGGGVFTHMVCAVLECACTRTAGAWTLTRAEVRRRT
ncbi:MAG TPA: hypothetical protein VFD69_18120 [Vicinamibacterales bacterium]|nr:hypothetical protein [Vicinamibacterales bacterium]